MLATPECEQMSALGPGRTFFCATEALQTGRLGGVVEERQEKRSK